MHWLSLSCVHYNDNLYRILRERPDTAPNLTGASRHRTESYRSVPTPYRILPERPDTAPNLTGASRHRTESYRSVPTPHRILPERPDTVPNRTRASRHSAESYQSVPTPNRISPKRPETMPNLTGQSRKSGFLPDSYDTKRIFTGASRHRADTTPNLNGHPRHQADSYRGELKPYPNRWCRTWLKPSQTLVGVQIDSVAFPILNTRYETERSERKLTEKVINYMKHGKFGPYLKWKNVNVVPTRKL